MASDFKTINWAEKLIELLLVILGITIAFSIEKCSETRSNRIIRKQIIQEIAVRIREDYATLGQCLLNNDAVIANSADILDVLRSKQQLNEEQLLATKTMYYDIDFTPSYSNITELRNTFNLGQIQDIELLNSLREMYGSYSLLEHYESIYTEKILTRHAEFWRKHYDEVQEQFHTTEDFNHFHYHNILQDFQSILGRKSRYYKISQEKTQTVLQQLAQLN